MRKGGSKEPASFNPRRSALGEQPTENAKRADPVHAGIVHFQAMFEVERRPAVLGGDEGFEGWTFKEGHRDLKRDA
jgi:hypothetical protein